ncbi:MAG TPA: hypothetical protein VMS37_02525, partial [Verrucomicrobiae bacterium]|nr:hypothetical protein [Verrucomicrobiae bacterium]
GGVPRDYGRAVSLFRKSCEDGWPRGCGGLGECYKAGRGVTADPVHAAALFERACRGGIAASCFAAGEIYRNARNEALATRRFQQACDLSVHAAIAGSAYFAAGVPDPSPASLPFCAAPAQ